MMDLRKKLLFEQRTMYISFPLPAEVGVKYRVPVHLTIDEDMYP